MEKLNIVWKDRKRPIFGLPLSFTKYKLLEDKILIDTGILSIKQEEIKLYRIMDVTLNRSIWQRIFKSTPKFDIKDIKNAFEVKELLSKMIEKERDKKRVSGREFFVDNEEDTDVIL